jgi:hypothetical protein
MRIAGFFYLAAIINFSQIKSCNKEKEILIWKENRKLSWKDFRQEAPRNSRHEAVSAIQIRMDYKIKVGLKKYAVYSLFKTNGSWTITNSDYLLIHEQVHFDLGEIYARLLRKSIRENKAAIDKSPRKKLDSLFNHFRQRLINAQTEYDSITNHSLNVEGQEMWNKRVKMQLDSLKNFK